jgi:uncharacterized protein DUF6516
MTPLQHYLLEVRQAVRNLPGAQVERYQEQHLSVTRANLRIRLRLTDHSLLEISEALVLREETLTWLSYRYHWQDADAHLIFRYDDTPHHPEVDTFPHHQHVAGMVMASQRPSLPHLLTEIQRRLLPG